MDSRDTIRRSLRARVANRVAGKGISRRAIDRAVDAVVDALPAAVIDGTAASASTSPSDGGVAEVVLAVTAVSVPDLASRVRRTLDTAGIRVSDAATATAGRHTVVTIRVRADARAATEQAAAAAGWKVSLVA